MTVAQLDPTIRLSNTGRHFEVVFPNPVGSTNKVHRVEIPISITGVAALAYILEERQTRPIAFQTIGSDSAPTQYIVDKWIQSNSIKTPESVRVAKAQAELTEMGLDTDSINIEELGL